MMTIITMGEECELSRLCSRAADSSKVSGQACWSFTWFQSSIVRVRKEVFIWSVLAAGTRTTLNCLLLIFLLCTGNSLLSIIIIVIIIRNPLTSMVVGARQMILQPVFCIFPRFPLPSRTCRTPSLSIPWCCLSTSSSVCLVFCPLSLWPCKMVLARHDEWETWPYHCSLQLVCASLTFLFF